MPTTRCHSCKYYLVFGCRCQKPKCRVQSPYFPKQGVGCTQYKPRT